MNETPNNVPDPAPGTHQRPSSDIVNRGRGIRRRSQPLRFAKRPTPSWRPARTSANVFPSSSLGPPSDFTSTRQACSAWPGRSWRERWRRWTGPSRTTPTTSCGPGRGRPGRRPWRAAAHSSRQAFEEAQGEGPNPSPPEDLKPIARRLADGAAPCSSIPSRRRPGSSARWPPTNWLPFAHTPRKPGPASNHPSSPLRRPPPSIPCGSPANPLKQGSPFPGWFWGPCSPRSAAGCKRSGSGSREAIGLREPFPGVAVSRDQSRRRRDCSAVGRFFKPSGRRHTLPRGVFPHDCLGASAEEEDGLEIRPTRSKWRTRGPSRPAGGMNVSALFRIEQNARRLAEVLGVLTRYGLADWFGGLELEVAARASGKRARRGGWGGCPARRGFAWP